MAYFPVGFLAVSLLALATVVPWTAPLLLIPVVLIVFIARERTVADRDTVTARTLLGSTTVHWDDIAGLKFVRSSRGRAALKDGGELPLPAVTFATLPLLTEASSGRVPNPYR